MKDVPVRAAFTLAGALAVGAFADEPEGAPGAGTRVGDGSRVTTVIGNFVRGADDVDDFVFDGIEGQVLSARVAGRDDLIPSIALLRPDGTSVGETDGAKFTPPPGPHLPRRRSATATFRLDATGAWTLRVASRWPSRRLVDDPRSEYNEGDDHSTPEVERRHVQFDYDSGRTVGRYTLAVELAKLPGLVRKFVVPDDDGRLSLVVPGMGGGTLRSSLTWILGDAPVFESLRAADGSDVPGFAETLETKAKSLTSGRFEFPEGLPLASYALAFRFDPATPWPGATFRATLQPPARPKPLRGTLDFKEPEVQAVAPSEGGPGTMVTVTARYLLDPNDEDGAPRILFGRRPAEQVEWLDETTLVGRAPADLPAGTHDVVVESTSGQAAVRAKAFRRLPPPDATALAPSIGSSSGGFDVTVRGTALNAAPDGMRVEFVDTADGAVVDVPVVFDPARQSDLRLAFRMPEGALALPPGVYRVRVTDVRSALSVVVPGTLEISDRALIAAVRPGLVSVLGGETVTVEGVQFDAESVVHLEDAASAGTFSAVPTTFHGEDRLSFVAPALPTGTWRVKVLTLGEFSPEASFAVFSFADLTPALGGVGAADPWDAGSTALADFDSDGDADLFLSRALTGVDEKQATPQTRVLRNDGTGGLTDVTSGTAGVMPVVSATDDWRADRVACADIDGDGRADLVLTTNSRTVPKASRSHTRILLNEPRAKDPADRVFRDRTGDLMPPPRTMQELYGGGIVTPDPWRGLDLWIGDLDRTGPGPPEIVVTHDEPKEDREVSCVPYCANPYITFYPYSMYWGGSRLFVWDRNARGGLGRYKFEHRFFPRRSGVAVQIFNPPAGVTIPNCVAGACRGKFTPFAGRRLAVGDLDGDERPDVAVLSAATSLPGGQNLATPLQVALTRITSAGLGSADVTSGVPDAGVGDALAIGTTAYPDGVPSGVVAVARATPPSAGSALRLWRFRPGVPPAAGEFEEITSAVLPDPLPAGDALQASVFRFLDLDADGDDDLVLLADAPPGGTGPALRVLRSERGLVDGVETAGLLRDSLRPLLETLGDDAGDAFDGVALSIGDLDGDDALDFVVSRADAATSLPTRAVRSDR